MAFNFEEVLDIFEDTSGAKINGNLGNGNRHVQRAANLDEMDGDFEALVVAAMERGDLK